MSPMLTIPEPEVDERDPNTSSTATESVVINLKQVLHNQQLLEQRDNYSVCEKETETVDNSSDTFSVQDNVKTSSSSVTDSPVKPNSLELSRTDEAEIMSTKSLSFDTEEKKPSPLQPIKASVTKQETVPFDSLNQANTYNRTQTSGSKLISIPLSIAG